MVPRGRVAQACRSLGAEGIGALKRLAEDFLVKIENGVEGLILTGGRQIAAAGQICQKVFQFLFARWRRRHGAESGHKLTEPIAVGGLSDDGQKLAASRRSPDWRFRLPSIAKHGGAARMLGLLRFFAAI